jgi:hypothetical protein
LAKRRKGGKSKAATKSRRQAPRRSGPLRRSKPRTQNAALLTRELVEARQQLAATAEVLKVISASTFDLQIVLDTLVESAALLCGADIAAIHRDQGSGCQQVATYGHSQGLEESVSRLNPFTPARGSVVGRTLLEGKTVHVYDVLADPEYTLPEWARRAGLRTALGLPLLREMKPIGVIFLARRIVRPFADREIELATIFADQAVIAIENVRLFDELRQRTNDLRESLQQQTATSEVLKVISRSTFDLQTVLDTLIKSAAGLCEADIADIHCQVGSEYRQLATYGQSPYDKQFISKQLPFVPARGVSVVGRTLFEAKPVHVLDVSADPEFTPQYHEFAKRTSRRTVRLFDEIQDKSHQLQVASQHKSQLPPGRARLATKPVPTGSPVLTNTIGITDVACLAASVPGVASARMTSTLSRTNSAAKSA